jgi:hypothetical protein
MLTLLPGQIPDRPSHIVVSHSGGKDSTLMLALMVEQFGGQVPITVHHQVLPEAWEGTVEYTQQTCDRYGVPLIVEQAHYHGYECPLCGNRWLSAAPKVKCTIRRTAAGSRGCGAEMGIVVAHIRGLVDLMNWRKMWPSPTIRWCTSYLKRDLYNKWIRRNRARKHRPGQPALLRPALQARVDDRLSPTFAPEADRGLPGSPGARDRATLELQGPGPDRP